MLELSSYYSTKMCLGLGLLLYFLTILIPNVSCLIQPQNITSVSFWKKFNYTGPVTLNYYSSIPKSSVIHCTVTCWTLYNWDQIYFQGGNCYCLAPVYAEADEVSGTVTTNRELRTMYQDVSSSITEGYTVFSDQRYCLKFFSTKSKFDNAESTCRQDGGHLISVHTQQDFDNFRSLYTHDQTVFVGGHRILNGSEFGWITGGIVGESFWKSGEPNDSGNENCIEIQRSGLFNDKSCGVEYAFICQILMK